MEQRKNPSVTPRPTEPSPRELDSTAAAPRNAQGLTLLASGQADAAAAEFRAALALAPGHPKVLFNLGLAAYAAGRLDDAEARWLAVLVQENPDLAWHLAALALRREDWSRGWILAEARFLKGERPVPRHRDDLPAWEGEELPATPLVVWGDQGLGDQIQFARFLPAVRARCPQLRLEVEAPLVRLLAAAFPDLTVAALVRRPSEADSRQQALTSLPRVLGAASAEALADNSAYLRIPAAAREVWQRRLGPRQRPRVGLAWAGSGAHPNDAARSAGLAALQPLFALDGHCDFHSLQVGPRAADGAGSAWPLVDWSGQIADLLDTAALIAELDLVVTVDTAIAHLAGSLGKPVWIALPAVPDWRWSETRGDATLWYPTARLFRQATPGDWAPVVAALAAALASRFPAAAAAALQPLPVKADADACRTRLAQHPLDRGALLRLAELAPRHADPKALLPFFHRGRSVPEAALMLARLLVRIDKKKAALAVLRPLTQNQGKLAYAWLLRSDLARQLHLAEEASAAARTAIALDAKSGEAWLHLANALREGKAKAEALEAIRRAAELAPRSTSVLNNLGVLLKEDRQMEAAIAAYRRALAVEPGNLAATTNLGSALREEGEFAESRQCFERALKADARNPDTWFGLGNTLKESGRTGEAIAAFRRALEVKPDHVDVQVNLSLLLLLSGEFAAGWDLYEQRFHRPKNPVKPRRFPQPFWQGESLTGQRLLVWGEQGAGDKLMAARLIPEIAATAEQVIVETDARLLRLFAHNFPECHWVVEQTPADAATAAATLQTPLLSLARFRRRDLAAFGDGGPYLRADPILAADWKERLPPCPGAVSAWSGPAVPPTRTMPVAPYGWNV